MAKYNWNEIKAKYETGKYSMKDLADEYGFNRRYGSRRANKENWIKGKSTRKVAEKATKKVMEEEANKEARLRKEYSKIINDIRQGAYKTLFEEKDFNRLKQFKIASQIMSNCRKEQWELNEIQEVAKKLEQNIGLTDKRVNMSDEEKQERLQELRTKLGDD